MNIAIIGTGYVGLVTGACFAEFGLKVICVDQDSAKIEGLKKDVIPIYEPGLEELVRKNVKEGRLSFTTNVAKAVENSLVVFIAVGTPSLESGAADLSYVEKVAETIAENMPGYQVIVTKSTVPVGTGTRLREIIGRRQREAVNFDIVSNPEFLREGSAIQDFLHPNRVVIGASSPQAVAIMKDLYRPLYLIEAPFLITSIETAELIKYASNAFLATKISFINEIAALCEAVGADVHQVAKGMGLDGRIGSKFLHPGPGFGGSCFPKDIRALLDLADENGTTSEILKAVMRVNDGQKQKMGEKIRRAAGDVAGKTIGVLGLAFKPNTDDMREAPALSIIPPLQAAGASIRAYDPAAMKEAAKALKDVTYCEDAYDAAKGADALVVLTEWNQFRNLDLERMKAAMNTPVLIDLRNVYEPEKMAALGFSYTGLGRGIKA